MYSGIPVEEQSGTWDILILTVTSAQIPALNLWLGKTAAIDGNFYVCADIIVINFGEPIRYKVSSSMNNALEKDCDVIVV